MRRQDHSVLQFGRSCIDTPIKLGTREFSHGLGTHANSEIVLHLPDAAREFQAFVGIDNNFDTGGVRGSVQFSVEIGGQEVFRTPTLRGTNEPVEVKVPIPAGSRELTLKADTTLDGPANDQADWADARIIKANGEICWADNDRQPFLGRALPFSFVYNGASSTNFLKNWEQDVKMHETPSRVVYEVSWKDPKTGLRVTATASSFKRYPAAEWVLEFQNSGSEDSDTGCSAGHPEWNQTQTYGLSLHLPLFGACSWVPEAYELRSAATAGAICQFGVLDPNFSIEKARAAIAEVKENQKFWYGDFYPLTPCTLGPGALIAYQFHRSDLDAGIVLAFRRSQCPYPVLETALSGLEPEGTYQVEFIDETRTRVEQILPGSELASNFELRLPKRASSLLVRYRLRESPHTKK